MDLITPFINWLLKSEYIQKNKLFLNAVQAKDNNVQIVTQQVAENEITKFVDGSKRYPITFSINTYKSISYDQIVKTMVSGNENVNDLLDVAKVIEFVGNMESNGDYPLFDNGITVEKVYCQYKTPNTPTIDATVSPALAKFTIPIIFEVFQDV